MRQLVFRAVLAACAAAITACQPVGGGAGQIGMRVVFPDEGFQVQMIPATTASIRVTVSGEGLTAPNTTTLTREQPALTLRVPSGPKTIDADAFDASGKRLAHGTTQVTVIAESKVIARVSLALASEGSPSPSPGPSSVRTFDPEPTPPPSTEPMPAPTPVPVPTTAPTAVPTAAPNGGALPAPTATPTPRIDNAITVVNGTNPATGAVDL